MKKDLEYRKVKYKNIEFYLWEIPLGNIKGFRTKINGITFICINKNMQVLEKSKELHRLIKMRKLKRFYTLDLRRQIIND